MSDEAPSVNSWKNDCAKLTSMFSYRDIVCFVGLSVLIMSNDRNFARSGAGSSNE